LAISGPLCGPLCSIANLLKFLSFSSFPHLDAIKIGSKIRSLIVLIIKPDGI
jgi:hypothetical protein